MANTSFNLHGKFVRQLKSYLAGLGYNEGRDYADAPYSRSVDIAGKHEIAFNNPKAGAEAKSRWTALRDKGFSERADS